MKLAAAAQPCRFANAGAMVGGGIRKRGD